MTCHEGIRLTLPRLGKARHAAKLTQMVKALLSTGEQLVYIGLVAHVKDEPIFCCIKNSFQCHRQLHHPQIGGQVSAGFCQMEHKKLPYFLAQLLPLLWTQLLQISVSMDFI